MEVHFIYLKHFPVDSSLDWTKLPLPLMFLGVSLGLTRFELNLPWSVFADDPMQIRWMIL